jgi:hypothetical protein
MRVGDGSADAITPVVRKMPDPMTLPSTKRMPERRPSARTSPSSGRVRVWAFGVRLSDLPQPPKPNA